MTLLVYAIFALACLVSAGIGVLAANWIWFRREERRREEALEPFLAPIELDVPRPWISLSDTNVVHAAAEGNATRVAALFREHSSPKPLNEAAE